MTWLFRVLDAKTSDADDRIEIAVYDVIGKSIFGEGVSGADVLRALNAKPKAKSILVRVSSIGGLLDDAKSMLNLLAERAAAGVDVEFRVDSLAASAAAYLLTTPGATVKVAENAFVMIHKARAGMRGTHEDMDAASKILRENDNVLAEAFAGASARRGKKKTKKDYLSAVANNADRYFGADEAIEWGLADGKSESLKVAACAVDISELVDPPEMVRSAPYAQHAPTVSVGSLVTVPTGTAVEGAVVAQVVASAIQSALSEEPTTPPITAATDSGSAGKEPSIMDLKVLAKLLGLPETANESDITAAIEKATAAPIEASAGVLKLLGADTQDAASARAQDLQKLSIALLACTGSTSTDQALAQVTQWRDSAAQATKLLAQLTEAQAQGKKAELEAMIQRLSGQGKLPPASHEWARVNFQTAQALEQFALSLPSFVSLGPTENAASAVQMTAEDREACRLTGCSEEAFLEAKKIENEKRRAQAPAGV